ncbi:MAG: hypothetical protein J6N49_00510 [Alphaproteobacteria bacterium]|nr:hypothetical protein [Alphaproteobacteria bacterium]
MNKEQLTQVLADLDISADKLLLRLINATGMTTEAIREMFDVPLHLVSDIQEVRPGMFLTNEGYVTKNYVADKTTALVLGTRKGKVKAMYLEGEEMPFSTGGLFVDTTGHNGLEATRMIVKEAREQHLPAEAAEYCQEFSLPGLVEKGDAFLLSIEEVREVQSYFFNIQEALRSVHFTSGCLWSSSISKDHETPCADVYALRSMTAYPESMRFVQFVHPAFWVPFRKSN